MSEQNEGKIYQFEEYRRKREESKIPSLENAVEMDDPAATEEDVNTYFTSTGEGGRHSVAWIEKAGRVKYIPNLTLEQSLMLGAKIEKMGFVKSEKFR